MLLNYCRSISSKFAIYACCHAIGVFHFFFLLGTVVNKSRDNNGILLALKGVVAVAHVSLGEQLLIIRDDNSIIVIIDFYLRRLNTVYVRLLFHQIYIFRRPSHKTLAMFSPAGYYFPLDACGITADIGCSW